MDGFTSGPNKWLPGTGRPVFRLPTCLKCSQKPLKHPHPGSFMPLCSGLRTTGRVHLPPRQVQLSSPQARQSWPLSLALWEGVGCGEGTRWCQLCGERMLF